MRNRIDEAFARTQRAGEAAFMPFLTAGDPDLATTGALIEEFARRGADLVELGIPYSDPVADGPTIQASYTRALARGFRLAAVFDMMKELRTRCAVPVLTMVSLSLVTRMGAEEYFARAAEAGVDGVIIPDLPADEGGAVARLALRAGLYPVFLVAPTTPPERTRIIARRSKGFIYYVSVTGTTGARRELPPDLAEHIAAVQSVARQPVAVGFGVSRPEQVAAVARIADGVIVGSAIVRKVHELSALPRAELVAAAGEFAAELAAHKKK